MGPQTRKKQRKLRVILTQSKGKQGTNSRARARAAGAEAVLIRIRGDTEPGDSMTIRASTRNGNAIAPGFERVREKQKTSGLYEDEGKLVRCGVVEVPSSG